MPYVIVAVAKLRLAPNIIISLVNNTFYSFKMNSFTNEKIENRLLEMLYMP